MKGNNFTLTNLVTLTGAVFNFQNANPSRLIKGKMKRRDNVDIKRVLNKNIII